MAHLGVLLVDYNHRVFLRLDRRRRISHYDPVGDTFLRLNCTLRAQAAIYINKQVSSMLSLILKWGGDHYHHYHAHFLALNLMTIFI